jgi:oligopeptide/dipeptide ABC transporter ATP-binding protein
VQAQILLEISRLKEREGMAILFITHDLGVVAQLCDRVLVMYAGRIVESAPVAEFFRSPRHPYSRGLMNSLPSLSADNDTLSSIPGSPPRPGHFPQGCRFNPRCPLATERCRAGYPAFEYDGEHGLACYEAARVREEIPLTR